jgi:hypothetical protein
MGSIRGGPVPGSPAFKSFQGVQPDVQAGSTIIPITVQGQPTPNEVIQLTVGTDATSVQPDTLSVSVGGTDSLSTVATNIAAAIQAAITAGSNPWATDFASASATGANATAVLNGGVDITLATIAVKTYPGSLLDILPVHYPEQVSTSSTEVTALKSFGYAGPTGVFRAYKNQRILVDNATAQDMISQGLAE